MKSLNFCINHVDSLGQGVSKDSTGVYFIPKTLPDETGEANVYKSSKGVNFCTLTNIEKPSPKRTLSPCQSFDQCAGCDFLHTDYENELSIKTNNIKFLYKKLVSDEQIEVIPAVNRFNYRNRIQLHYDKGQKKMGFIGIDKKSIVEVKSCQIVSEKIREEIIRLYENQLWLQFVLREPKTGHIEFYERGSRVQIEMNKDYGFGGFTQVNPEMNQKLLEKVTTLLNEYSPSANLTFDLFSGNGNLSKEWSKNHETFLIDNYTFPDDMNNAMKLDLYTFNSHKRVQNKKQVDTFLIDPPRSGFKTLHEWVNNFKPKSIVYVSCNPSTQKRDIEPLLNDFLIQKLILIDLFPSTHHLESIIVLTKKV